MNTENKKELIDRLKKEHEDGDMKVPTEKFDVPSNSVTLPSQGFYYTEDNPLSKGQIILRYPTAKDEDILTSKVLIKKGIVLDVFLSNLIVDKNIKLDDMLLGDKNAILVASRVMAYGTEYNVKVNCPACDEKSEISINLGDLETKDVEFNEDRTNRFEFTLPKSKKTIVYKLLTSGDEKAIKTELNQMKQYMTGGVSPENTVRLKHSIVSVDGDENRNLIRQQVDHMMSFDSKQLKIDMKKHTPDVDFEINFSCKNPECGHEDRMTMPLDVEFFWPSS